MNQLRGHSHDQQNDRNIRLSETLVSNLYTIRRDLQRLFFHARIVETIRQIEQIHSSSLFVPCPLTLAHNGSKKQSVSERTGLAILKVGDRNLRSRLAQNE
jgi:hypothetical protein